MGVIIKNGISYGGTSSSENGGSSQVYVMPTPSSILVNKIVQYAGPTTLEYTMGYFYKCVEDKTTTPTSYSWEEAPTQDVSAKADKVDNATNGHLAGLNANGNLTDSGIDPTTLQPKTMSTPITVDDTEQTTVEGTLGALNILAASNKTNKQNKTLDTSLTIDGTTATTVEGALGTLNTKKINTSEKGAASGIAELDSNGKVPSSQLPSYVDDVIEGYYNTTDHKFYKESTYVTEITGESGKIYLDLSTDTTWRWSGSVFTQIKGDLTLGETSTTAYRGDRGKAAYDHSQSDHNTVVPTFTEASTRANITSGDSLSTIFGKIKKFFTDLKTVAFTGSYNDLSDKPNKTVFYGTCTGQAENQTKAIVVDSSQNFALTAGIILLVKFDANNTYSATADAPVKLDVNSTGAKNIYYGATNTPTGTNTTPFGRTNYVNQYYYDGTNWIWSGSSADNNTTYSNMSATELTTGTATAGRSISAKVLNDWLNATISPIIDTVTDVEDVDELPADAAQHPTTLYLIKES